MSIVQQFNDGFCKATEGKSKEEQDRMMKMLADAFKKNNNYQECSLRALVNKREPQAKCVKCNKMFLIEEIAKANGCPDCKQNEEFDVLEE
jgi:Zn finger protein HypA/HybF involved in hydrogenase expression